MTNMLLCKTKCNPPPTLTISSPKHQLAETLKRGGKNSLACRYYRGDNRTQESSSGGPPGSLSSFIRLCNQILAKAQCRFTDRGDISRISPISVMENPPK